MPINSFNKFHTIKLLTKTQPKAPCALPSCPKRLALSLVSGTNNIPTNPPILCTDIAPTGPSSLDLSIAKMEKTTITPANSPNMIGNKGDGVRGSAVMVTNSINAKSALPNNKRAVIKATMARISPLA